MPSSDAGEALDLHALFAQPDNAAVLAYLGFGRPEDVRPFEVGTVGHPLDEGERFSSTVTAAAFRQQHVVDWA
jgi:hypothetical protein